jgi:DNA repair exonuclease SbcCD ATPase subunit
MNLNVNSELLRNILLDANIIGDEDKVTQQEISQKLTELQKFIEDAKGVKSALARLRREASTTTTAVEDLEGQLESKSLEVETLLEQQEAANSKIKDLEFHMIQKEEQKREAQKKFQDLQYKYNELERDMEEVKNSSKSIQSSQDSSFNEKKKLQDEIVTHKQRIQTLEGHLNELKAKTERFRNETKNQHSSATDTLNQTIETLTKQVEALTEENKILESRCVKAEMEAGNLETLAVEQTKSGWLNKKSPNETFGQKFQKRFFVLKGISLSYFKTDKDDLSKPLGTLFLDKSTITSPSEGDSVKKYGIPFAIEISIDNNVSSGKIVLLFAAYDGDHKAWLQSINQAKNTSQERTTRTTRAATSSIGSINKKG